MYVCKHIHTYIYEHTHTLLPLPIIYLKYILYSTFINIRISGNILLRFQVTKLQKHNKGQNVSF